MGKLCLIKRKLAALLAAVMILTGVLQGYVPVYAETGSDSGITLTVIGDTADHGANPENHTGYVYWLKNSPLSINLNELEDKYIAKNCGEQIRAALAGAGITCTEATNLFMSAMTKGGVTLDAGDYSKGYWSVIVAYADGSFSADGWGEYEAAAQLKPGCRLIYYWSDKPSQDPRITKDALQKDCLTYDTDAVTAVTLYTQEEQDKALTSVNMEAGTTKAVLTRFTVPAASVVAKNLTWTSDNEAVATAAATAQGADITAVSAGSALITASMVNTLGDTVSAAFLVNVTASGTTIEGMSFSPDHLQPMVPGDSEDLTTAVTPSFTPALAAGEKAPALRWSSDNEAVATVSSVDGEVTAVAPGTANITGSFVNNQGQTISAVVVVTVSEVALTAITMDRAFVTVDAGKSESLKVQLTPANATDIPEIVWTSDDEAVATVTGTGVNASITGVNAGTATITATAGELTATCEVTVRAAQAVNLLKSLKFASNAAGAVIYDVVTEFDPETKECIALVPENVNSFYLTAELADGVTGTIKTVYKNYNKTKDLEKAVTPGTATGFTGTARALQSDQEARTMKITVTAGSRTEEYNLTIKRTSLIKSLQVTDADGNIQSIDPVFAITERAFSLSVPDTVTELKLAFAANNANSTVLTVNGQPAENGEFTLPLTEVVTKAVICAGNEKTVPAEYVLTVTKQTPRGITFAVNPSDAIVTVYKASDNASVSGENNLYTVLPGEYKYVVSKTGYVAQTGTITVDDQPVVIEADLKKAPESDITILDSEWPSIRNDDNNQGITSAPTAIDKDRTGTKWEVRFGAAMSVDTVSSPILVDGYLYAYSGNSLLKIDKETGTIVASGEMVGKSSFAINPPSYANGMIFVGLSGGRIQAFNAQTLKSLWVYTDALGGQPNCSMKYSDGYIYTGFWNAENKVGRFACISVTDEDPSKTDEEKVATWTYAQMGGFYWADALTRGNYVMVGTDDGENGSTGNSYLLVFNKTTGELVQKISGHVGDIRSGISYYNNRIYFTTKGGYLYTYNLKADGTVDTDNKIEPLKLGDICSSTPVIYNNRLYAGTVVGSNFSGTYSICVVDVNAETGALTLAYKLNTDAYPQTSGALTTAYAEGEDGYYYVYFTTNGPNGNLWVVKDRPGMTEPSSDSGILYSPINKQYCISSVIVDSDGVMYYKNDASFIIAVEKMDVALNGITVTGGEALLDDGAAFDNKVSGHEIAYQSGTETLTVTANVDDNVVVEMNGVKGSVQEIAIAGLDKIEVKVSNEEAEKVYTFTLREKSKNTNVVMTGTSTNSYNSAYTLLPEYDPEVTEYYYAYNTGKTFLSIWAEPEDPRASLVITAVSGVQNKTEGTEIPVTATSGGHKRYAIYFADTTYKTPAKIKITVTSEDKTAEKSVYVTISIDNVKPELTVEEESVTNRTKDTADVTITASEMARLGYSAEETVAASIFSKGKGMVVDAGQSTITLEELGPDATDVYLVLKDAAANYSVIKKISVPAAEGYEESKAVKEQIEALPAAEEITLSDKEAVEAARDAYEALSPEAKEFVDTEALEAAEEKIAELEKEAEKKPLPYTDVPETAWYAEYVDYTYQKGLMTGMNDTTFGPAVTLSRAQYAMILYRMAGSPEVEYTEKFPDVPETAWYASAVLWAANAGVVGGYQNGKFGPSDSITREQMAVMTYRYAKSIGMDVSAQKDLEEFADGKKVSSFAKTEMQWAVANGIISGNVKSDGTYLNPQGKTNRAECATIVTRFDKLRNAK